MREPVIAYALQYASLQASLLVARAGFRADDWEDLKDEILLDFLRRAPRFDPTRGDWQGFVRGVARNCSTVLITRHHRGAREVLSGDLVGRQDADIDDATDGLGRPSSDTRAELDLRLDIERVLFDLPLHLQSLALLLGQMTIREVCAHTGKSRSRVYQLTRKIRNAFVAAGFGPTAGKAGRQARPLPQSAIAGGSAPKEPDSQAATRSR